MAVFAGDATDSPTTAYGNLTGNITITNARVVNGADQRMTTVSAGQEVYIEADFTTLALPSTASYRVSYDVNGVTLDSGYVTWGAGDSGAENWYLYWGYFVASPGTNQVTATVDPDQSVPETTYTDNSMSFSFTGASTAAINLINSSGQEADTVLNGGGTFTTSFLGTNDVTIQPLVSPPSDDYGIEDGVTFAPASASNNNPSYLSSFVGSPLQGTGKGTAGAQWILCWPAWATQFQMNFTIPIGPSSEIVFGDIDYDEVVTVTAFDGTTPPSPCPTGRRPPTRARPAACPPLQGRVIPGPRGP